MNATEMLLAYGRGETRALYGMPVPKDVWLPPAYDITFDDVWRLSVGRW